MASPALATQPVPDAVDATVHRIEAAAYEIPTDGHESDGTYAWDSTSLVVVHVFAGDACGLGYTYTHAAAARLINTKLAEAVRGLCPMNPIAAWDAMYRQCRNLGQPGLASCAVSAVDCALWDLKARLVGLPLVSLMGGVRQGVPLYGSGGFTSYSDDRLQRQLAGWAEDGIPRVKMKVGREAALDGRRVEAARKAVGDHVELFVDANGGYSVKQALAMGRLFHEEFGVSWYEEPRPSHDLEGLREVREQGPPGLEVAAGEYGYRPWDFRHMLEHRVVDCLQADVTRCGGYTGFIAAAALCEASLMPLSGHCCPQQHAHVCCATRPTRHLEYFHDHVRVERMLFDGILLPVDGELRPDLTRTGNGLVFKREDAEQYRTD